MTSLRRRKHNPRPVRPPISGCGRIDRTLPHPRTYNSPNRRSRLRSIIQLLENVREMSLRCVPAEVQQVGDFRTGAALRQKLRDLALAIGEQLISVLRAAAL